MKDVFDFVVDHGRELVPVSADDVRAWSSGEIVNSAGRFYDPKKFAVGGLECEDIFGELGSPEREERFGHITLRTPCAHPWLMSVVWALIGVGRKQLELVVDRDAMIVIEAGASGLLVGDVLPRFRANEALEKHGPGGLEMSTGAEALMRLLEQTSVESREQFLTRAVEKATDSGDANRLRTLENALALAQAARRVGLRTRDLVVEVLPVPPPSRRSWEPSSHRGSNDLYQHVLLKNQRLETLEGAPEHLVDTGRRALQESVDDVLTAGIGRMLLQANLGAGDEPSLARVKLDAKVTARSAADDEDEEPQIVRHETTELRRDGASELLRNALASHATEAPSVLIDIVRALQARLATG